MRPKAGKSPTCRLMPSPRNDPAMALRSRFQKGIFVAWQGNGMVCVNQTRPHCVNQMGKAQSTALAERHGRGTAWERHGMCESAFTGTLGSNGHLRATSILGAVCSRPKATKTHTVKKFASSKMDSTNMGYKDKNECCDQVNRTRCVRSIHISTVSQKDKLPLRYWCGIFYNTQVPFIIDLTL
jgi:hypothetical protein